MKLRIEWQELGHSAEIQGFALTRTEELSYSSSRINLRAEYFSVCDIFRVHNLSGLRFPTFSLIEVRSMRNLCALKISAVVTIGSLAALAAMPAKAQQVILTPGGTMLMPTMPGRSVSSSPFVGSEAISTPESELPRYEVMTPEQIKPGKIILRGREIEILSPDDSRITAEQRSQQKPSSHWVISKSATGQPIVSNRQDVEFFYGFQEPRKPIWDGIIQVGKKIPGFMMTGELIILSNDDPRIPTDLRGVALDDSSFWAIAPQENSVELPSGYGPRAGVYRYTDDGHWLDYVTLDSVRRQANLPLVPDNPVTTPGPIDDSSELIVILPPDEQRYVSPLPTPINSDYLFPTTAANNSVNNFSIPATASTPPAAIAPTARPSIQGSQNPSVDFAAANGFDRSRLPAQLNRQLLDSPLSSSRIFPGMR